MSNPNPITYIATINTPGYLPEAEPTYHDTCAAAWAYLADERDHALDDAEVDAAYDRAMHDMSGRLVTGTVIAPTPGYDGDHDLGVAYSVDAYAGVVCADCGARFAHTDEALAHWDREHD